MKEGPSIQATLLLAALLTGGCSTNSVGLKNPEFSGYRMTHPAVVVLEGTLQLGLKLEEEMIEKLAQRGISAEPLTRRAQFFKDAEQAQDAYDELIQSGVTEFIFLSFGEIRRSEVVQYQSTSNVTMIGSTGYVNSTTVPVEGRSRQMHVNAEIVDAQSGDVVWKGGSTRHAQGLLFTGDGAMIGNSVEGLLQAFRDDGLLPR